MRKLNLYKRINLWDKRDIVSCSISYGMIIMFAISLLAGALMMSSTTVAYAGNLEVVFEADPLFNEANFLPGNEVVRTVEVTNNTEASQNVLTESINAVDNDGLGDVLNFVIKEGPTTLYEDTLGNFLREGEVPLSALGAGASTVYSFGVTFDVDADNDTQATGLGFDLCVGFEGGETNCGGTVVGEEENGTTDNGGGGSGGGGGGSGGGGGGGGGGGNQIINLETLQVFNERVTDTNVSGATAVIEWDSNLLSTSQVVYGKKSEGPYSLNLTVLPYFGYPLGSVEDPTKTIHHSVLLTGLDIGETYVYRVVSRASPPTVGFQYEFVMNEGGGTGSPASGGGDDGGGIGGFDASIDGPLGGAGSGGSGAGGTGSGATRSTGTGGPSGGQGGSAESTTTATKVSTTSTQGAALGLLDLPDSLQDWFECLGHFLIFVALIYIVWTIWKKRNSNNYTQEELSKLWKLFFFVGSLVSILIAYLIGWNCTILPPAILAVICLILYIIHRLREKDEDTLA